MWFNKRKINVDQLLKVEGELKIKLPEFFWDFYRKEYKLINKLRDVSNDEDFIHFTTDFDWMIEHNRDFLKLPKDYGVCRNKLCIGTDGCGNDSFISLNNEDQRVFFLDHEISGELFSEINDDFDWEDERLEKFDSLKSYLQYKIEIIKG